MSIDSTGILELVDRFGDKFLRRFLSKECYSRGRRSLFTLRIVRGWPVGQSQVDAAIQPDPPLIKNKRPCLAKMGCRRSCSRSTSEFASCYTLRYAKDDPLVWFAFSVGGHILHLECNPLGADDARHRLALLWRRRRRDALFTADSDQSAECVKAQSCLGLSYRRCFGRKAREAEKRI